MTLLGFLTRRFALYVTVIAIFMAGLFTVVEFFEKFLRVSPSAASSIFYFSILNFLPTLVDLLPVCTWLATILLIRELVSRQEWDFLALLTFIPRAIFRWIFVCGVVMMATVFVYRETVGAHLALRAARVRQEKFKQHVHTLLLKQWFLLDEQTVFYARVLDQKDHLGCDLLFAQMNDFFTAQTMLVAPAFLLHQDTHTVEIPVGTLYDLVHHTESIVKNHSFSSPSLFLQMRMHYQTPTLIQGAGAVISQYDLLPLAVKRDLIRRCLVHVGYYLSLVLYPLLTMLLFLSFLSTIVRWICVLLPYPYFVFLGFAMESLVTSGWPVWFVVAPHLLGFLLFLMAYFMRFRRGVISN